MFAEQHRILDQFNATAAGGSGPAGSLKQIGASVEAVSALRTYFAKLADVAPAPIEEDAKLISQSYEKELGDASQAAANPLGSVFAGLVDSMTSSSQITRGNDFALRRCGHSL